jgi:predicted nucleotidyltransferase
MRHIKLQTEFQRWRKILINKYKPKSIFLFGSFGDGKTKEWSDIDIIIIKKTDKRFFDRIKEVILLLKPKVGVDILVYTPEEFDELSVQRTFFRKEVLKKAIKVYERRG